MHVRWKQVGILQRADTNKANNRAQSAAHAEVVAPKGNLAFCTSRKLLTSTTRGGNQDFSHLSTGRFNPVRLDQCVGSK